MDCIINGVAKSRTRLSDFNFHFSHHASLWEVREGRQGTVSNRVTLGGLTKEVSL